MTYAEIRRELLSSARETEYFRCGLCKETAAALLAADRFHFFSVESEVACWNSIDEYYGEEIRAQYSADADKYEELASLYYQYAANNGADYML